jgi:hypothetical protein
MEFPKQYRVAKEYMRKLDKVARSERYLAEKWILDQEKNRKYKQERQGDKITKMDTEYLALVGWLLPDVRYEYRQVKQEELCNFRDGEYKLFRSSIIPVVNIQGVNHWMLGSFADYTNEANPILTDFAGRCERIDLKEVCPATSCALRELQEESKGLLVVPIQEAMKNPRNVAVFEGINEEKREKVYFLFVSLKYEHVKDIPTLFSETDMSEMNKNKKEQLGPIAFYKQSDVKSFKYRTAKNLTDFIYFLNK